MAFSLAVAGMTAALQTHSVMAAEPASTVRAVVDIPAGPLGHALASFATANGVLLSFDSTLAAGKTSLGLRGAYSVEEGFARLLSGSGLEAVRKKEGGYTLRVLPAAMLPEVKVTAAVDPQVLPDAYAGGQVAKGGRLGLLGNKGVMDTPFNLTSYTSALMADQQAITINDVIANDPSIRMTGSGLASSAGGGDTMMIRGFELRGRDIAFDGVYGIAPTRVFPVETLERAEVLKGPNALLNGMAPSGAVGGAINVVPKRAGDDPLTRVTASTATGGLSGMHLDFGRRSGEDKRWGMRFNGIYRDGGTAVEGQAVNMGVATIGIDFRDDRLRASLDAGYQNIKTDAPGGAAGFYVTPGGSMPKPPKAEKQISQDWEFSKSKSQYVLAKAEYDISPDWTVYGAAGMSSNDDLFLSADKAIIDNAGNATATAYYFPAFSDRKSLQGGLRGTVHTGSVKHELNFNASVMKEDSGVLLGAQYGFFSFPTNIYSAPNVPKPSLAGFKSSAPKTSDVTMPTVAISDTLSWMDGRVALTVGVRHQSVRTNSYDPVTGAKTPGYDDSAVTPAVALLVKPLSNLSLYANYVEGLSQGPTAWAGTANAGQMFAPIKSKQVEGGVKYDFGRIAMTASLFQIERPNGVLAAVPGVALPVYKMDGEQRNRGVELNVFGEAVRNVRVLGGLAYTNGELTRTQGGLSDGNTAVAVPRWQANLAAEWDTPFVPGLTVSARLITTSSQYVDPENLSSIPGWTRWDAGVRYKTRSFGKPLVLRANIENLFGRDYWMTASEGWLNQGMPRTLLLSATMDF
jgi:iron complex outermembrane receptor protein